MSKRKKPKDRAAIQARSEVNNVLRAELARRNIPYLNMRHSTHVLAAALELNIVGLSKVDAKSLVWSKITGEKFIQVNATQASRKPRKPRPKRWNAKLYDADHVVIVGPTQSEINSFYDSWEWSRLSYDVKLERGRACECCGAKPPKVVIHTDHVKPIRYFWHLRLVKSNLQILCEGCNRGKGSRDMTDFREEVRP